MNLSEINWDFNASGSWPTSVKASFIALTCLVVSGGWVYLDTLGQLDELEKVQKKELELKSEFEKKQNKASNLQDYEYQLTQIEAQLYEVIRQMPTKEEVANLLIDISQMGMTSGLEFKLFKMGPSISKDFYSELPISIQVIGRYDELGLFISGLASLPRIVTIHDISIIPLSSLAKNDKSKDVKSDDMIMNAIIKTYNESTGTASDDVNKNSKTNASKLPDTKKQGAKK